MTSFAPRQPGWEGRLLRVLARASREDWSPATTACGLFCADCVEAITGVDPAAELRGRFETEREGLVLVRRLTGARGLRELCHRLFEQAPVSELQPGDIAFPAVRNSAVADVPGVVQGARIYLRAPRGLAMLPLTEADLGFRVG